ncbi:hypothetical protein ENKNEFLB_03365 [Nocardioides aquaticus]|uniref:Rod shape-determining protein MreD n=1 Tax=Nocardioides aquaticus TaxID=160826 RepID=A0ABX8EKA6_9ACTN|nr:rod shape-determining protein MreD [Nocardioides aquaticus]QVT80964.1 hypothetical protein ENKNEFLB_03365 [Nocardioides aquaticus]
MSGVRVLAAAAAVLVAALLQVSVLSQVSWHGVVPNLVLLVVVAAGLVRGASFAMVLGLAAGLLLDLAPPADHVAGQWALALVLVGLVAGQVNREARSSAVAVVATVAVCSLLGTTVFALTGALLGDPISSVGSVLGVVGLALLLDVLLTPLVLPPLMAMFRRLEPVRALAWQR